MYQVYNTGTYVLYLWYLMPGIFYLNLAFGRQLLYIPGISILQLQQQYTASCYY